MAWAIRFITKQKASHAWISFYDEFLDQRMVMEASNTGYRLLPIGYWARQFPGLKTWVFVYRKDGIEIGVKEIAKKLGTEYDVRFMLWHATKRWFKRLWNHPGNSPNKMACSEANVRIMQVANVPGSSVLDPELMTPGDLLCFLNSSNYFYAVDISNYLK